MSKISWVIFTIIIFFLGMGTVFVFEKTPVAPTVSSAPSANLSKTISTLNSGIVDVVARGATESINGKEITLNRGGIEKLTIKISDSAKIVALQPPKDQNSQPTEKQVNFDQIKKGNNVEVVLKIQPDQSVLGQTVYIYPPVAAVPKK